MMAKDKENLATNLLVCDLYPILQPCDVFNKRAASTRPVVVLALCKSVKITIYIFFLHFSVV